MTDVERKVEQLNEEAAKEDSMLLPGLRFSVQTLASGEQVIAVDHIGGEK